MERALVFLRLFPRSRSLALSLTHSLISSPSLLLRLSLMFLFLSSAIESAIHFPFLIADKAKERAG